MSDNAKRIRTTLTLRRFALFAPLVIIVLGVTWPFGLRLYAPDLPTETRSFYWREKYITAAELYAVNATLPLVLMVLVAAVSWRSLVLRMPPLSSIGWGRRAVGIGLFLSSLVWLGVVALNEGQWPNTGLNQ